MNWSAIGAVGEVTGALVVLLTLIYLAIQLRQNTNQLKAAAREATQKEFNDLRLLIFGNREVAHLYRTGLDDLDNLDETDKLRFIAWYDHIMSGFEGLYERIKDGTMEHDANSMEKQIARFISSKGGRESWIEIKYRHSEAFQQFVDDLAESHAHGKPQPTPNNSRLPI